MIDLDAIEKLLAEATPGPWQVGGDGYTVFGPDVVIADCDNSEADAALIAAAPALLTDLVAENRLLRECVARADALSAKACRCNMCGPTRVAAEAYDAARAKL